MTAVSMAGRNGMSMSGGAVLRQGVNDDWTFFVSGVVGAARLRVNVPEAWAVKAVFQGNRDIADVPLDMKSGEELTELQVVLTDRVATWWRRSITSRTGSGTIRSSWSRSGAIRRR